MSTESADPRFVDIDRWPTLLAVEAMLEGQLAAVASVKSQTRQMTAAIEAASGRLVDGGRLVYVGAGTSGRIAVQDGVELAPTYGWPEEQLLFILAGDIDALARSAEGAEDDADAARAAVGRFGLGARDVVIGVAASGHTPFTVGAVETARAKGALTIAIANNRDAPLLKAADFPILADTGSELIAGSTRMKAGTAQKVVLNLLSTAIMLRCGLVYRGLMVSMRVSNEKLARRARSIVMQVAGVDGDVADRVLAETGEDIKKAILLAMGAESRAADDILREARYNLRTAIADLEGKGG